MGTVMGIVSLITGLMVAWPCLVLWFGSALSCDRLVPFRSRRDHREHRRRDARLLRRAFRGSIEPVPHAHARRPALRCGWRGRLSRGSGLARAMSHLTRRNIVQGGLAG